MKNFISIAIFRQFWLPLSSEIIYKSKQKLILQLYKTSVGNWPGRPAGPIRPRPEPARPNRARPKRARPNQAGPDRAAARLGRKGSAGRPGRPDFFLNNGGRSLINKATHLSIKLQTQRLFKAILEPQTRHF